VQPPRRRCVACGRIAPKHELLRLALRAAGDPLSARSAVTVDHAQTMPGRGAYVCSAECLRRAADGRRLGGAFRRAVSIDAQTVESVS
jgi:predicted RNA-binding protein YlxR (DUF448 family)